MQAFRCVLMYSAAGAVFSPGAGARQHRGAVHAVSPMLDAFLREIPSEHGLISVVLAEGSPQVSVYSGPFSWQIDLRDLSSDNVVCGDGVDSVAADRRDHAPPTARRHAAPRRCR